MKTFKELKVGDKITRFYGNLDRTDITITEIIEKSGGSITLSYGPGEYQKYHNLNPGGYLSINRRYNCSRSEVIIPSENSPLIDLYEAGFNNGVRDIQNKLQDLIGIES